MEETKRNWSLVISPICLVCLDKSELCTHEVPAIVGFDFDVVTVGEAKQKVLNLAKDFLRDFPSLPLALVLMAMPFGKDEDGKEFLVGDEMLRNRLGPRGEISLETTDPEPVFVQGYGPQAHKELQKP